MQQRPCPTLGRPVSVLGFGGIVLSGRPQADCDREVAAAVDQGFTYFDVAPQYGDAQERMGPALRPFRDRVVLNCKTLERGGPAARAQLDDSLKKLETDRFDVYQLHAVTTEEDVDRVLAPGGALEALEGAQRAGKCRALGFSAHGEDAALRLIATGRFRTMLLPLNAVMFERGVFGPRALAAANAAGMTVYALKAMARGKADPERGQGHPKCWYEVEDRAPIAELALRYTLGLPGVVAALPPGQPELFRVAAAAATRAEGPALTTPLDADEKARLLDAMAGSRPLFPAAAA